MDKIIKAERLILRQFRDTDCDFRQNICFHKDENCASKRKDTYVYAALSEDQLKSSADHILETERLFLRELNNDDFDALYRVFADKDSMRHYPYTFDEERVRKWIETNIERYRVFGFGLWAVCLKETGEMIGDCGLTMQNINGFIRPEIGYHIRSDKQRCGYAKEAASAVRDWAFSHTTFKIVYSYMRAENIPSVKTAESIGMYLVNKYADDVGIEISVYAIEKMKNEQIQ